MIKPAILVFATAVSLMGAASAHAGVRWSVGVNLPVPVVGAVVSNGPVYAPGYYGYAPAYAPVPVYAYAPAPVYVAPAPVYGAGYYPGAVYYRPVPVLYPSYRHRGRHRGWR